MILTSFGLLLAGALTRQINGVLGAGLPLALLPLAGKEFILRGVVGNLGHGPSRFRYSQRFLIFVVVGLSAIGTSLLVQQTKCWLFRVPFRSTFGQTFTYRMSYLQGLPAPERTAILARINTKLADPAVTESLDALNRSLNQRDGWTNTFLYDKINEILDRSGFHETQGRTYQVDLKLNRIATCVLLSGEPHFREVVWDSFMVSPFFAQTDLGSAPFELTDWLQKLLPNPRYARLRGLGTFQHQEGYYNAVFQRIPYFLLFERVPMVEMAFVTIAFAIVFAGLALIGHSRDPVTEAGAWYATSMVVTALLISFATCLSTYFQARLFLPVYSLYQMSMLLALSLAADFVLRRLKRFRKSH
jgi:hypothetical protein